MTDMPMARATMTEIKQLRAKLTEAAAFLDAVASWLEVGGVWNTGHDPAADCRVMAQKLRGETMPHFYDYQGNAICEACSEQIPDGERDGPHYVHWFQCQECKREFGEEAER